MLRVLVFLSGISVLSVMGQDEEGQADAVVDAVVDAVGVPEDSAPESTDQTLTEGEEGRAMPQRATTADIKVPEISLAQSSEGDASGLVSGEAQIKVESRLSLRDKIQNRLSQIKAKKAEMEASDEYKQQQIAESLKGKKAKVLAARDNLLDSAHLHGVFHSLFQKDEKDAYMDAAVKRAAKDMSGKGRTKVTLEERIAQIDNVDHAMETKVSSELSGIFADLMGRHKKCTQCSRDCPAMRWSEYGAHTLAECEQYCKLIVCKEWDDPHKPYEQEVARFEEERKERAKNPRYAKSTVFQNYLPDYLREYGPESLVVNDDGEYELSWELPANKTEPWEIHNDEDVHPDPMESLRELPPLPGKSAEDVLKEIAQQEEAEKLVPAFETSELDDKSVMWTRKDLDRELKTQVRERQGSHPPELL
eukprot:gnl/MRDRNA2_/MRDRNA2_113308_c0_seq1.p1 gnl/MRDRNA2_/MRDRNA2_113308_c0~~gnl/MRDRNA2_/MRDRNA2_113308_c0_seq1.p1  ORF type:complete len:420 (-),score=109.19 gnl/MRDRNA2_/MRDRNA2_113308_c0_seq1:110-1369(-)